MNDDHENPFSSPHDSASSGESIARPSGNTTCGESIVTPPPGNTKRVVPLRQLRPQPQWIECPKCGETAQTQVQGRSKGMQTFMNVFWWPLPGRKYWWEKTRWLCGNCEAQLAMQKNNEDLVVMA
ncbi:LITAF-like zinc ribbon domain-containing protein [Purpureocillium lavendulum]|uniref:LITAF-like zinc ribbon domain-containing protein n=1 Tax=Purpureocillium lavendulum TaxID=1247861 RepID=A0AB34FK79_9HYPO|nr:LITAF-like zinc ribbon domain-containing protein [Purpureocillium lavendulum]